MNTELDKQGKPMTKNNVPDDDEFGAINLNDVEPDDISGCRRYTHQQARELVIAEILACEDLKVVVKIDGDWCHSSWATKEEIISKLGGDKRDGETNDENL